MEKRSPHPLIRHQPAGGSPTKCTVARATTKRLYYLFFFETKNGEITNDVF